LKHAVVYHMFLSIPTIARFFRERRVNRAEDAAEPGGHAGSG